MDVQVAKKKKIYFFVPMNYTGWVNIVFNDSTAKSGQIKFSDGLIYLIGRKPDSFLVSYNIFEAGSYEEHYYYYDADTSIKLNSLGYPTRNIFFGHTTEFQRSGIGNKISKKMTIYSFYVSKIPLNIDSVSMDLLSKNKF